MEETKEHDRTADQTQNETTMANPEQFEQQQQFDKQNDFSMNSQQSSQLNNDL